MKKIRVDMVQSEIRSTVAASLAEALICGIDQAKQEKHELTQLQQIDLATMTVMAYEKALMSIERIEFWSDLERLAGR